MNKRLSSLLIGLLLAVTAQAQWVRQPFTFAGTYELPLLIDAVDDNTAWALSNGQLTDSATFTREIARTFDGGQNWTVLPVPAVDLDDETLQSLSAVSATTAWVVSLRFSAACRVFKTTTAGSSWVVQSTPAMFSSPDSWPNTIHFFNANDGVVLGDPDGLSGGGMEIYYTADGGTTWTRAAGVPVGTDGEYGTPFPPATFGSNIWVPNSEGDIFHSADKGITWTVVRGIGTAAKPIESLAFRDERNGLALTGDDQGSQPHALPDCRWRHHLDAARLHRSAARLGALQRAGHQ